MTGAPTGAGPSADAPVPAAVALLDALGARGWSVAVAESLTGGLVVACLIDVPGASRVVRGGVVAYATDLKATLVGVDAALLAARGPVDPEVAMAMAEGVRHRLGADVGLATTGVAGPDPQHGHVPGTVHVAVAAPTTTQVRSMRLAGERGEVRAGARAAVLELALEIVGARG
ncbi:MAG TPA: nicotinamide-nucleotide amidohydrolase family protein [Cellulomonas sp.]|nr:nicotinamide-nucleotide amidohydrolase family protein [Cellulomonas sp.]